MVVTVLLAQVVLLEQVELVPTAQQVHLPVVRLLTAAAVVVDRSLTQLHRLVSKRVVLAEVAQELKRVDKAHMGFQLISAH
jgi:hypothetical protein